jgi:ribosomal protein S18 acetylase RimI-like enzyme
VLVFTNNDGPRRGARHVWHGEGRTQDSQRIAVTRCTSSRRPNGGLVFEKPIVLAEADDSHDLNLKTAISMPQFLEHHGRARMTLWRTIRSGGVGLLLKVGRKTISAMRSVAAFVFSVQKRCAPFPHWHLSVIGVAPAWQGRSHARVLLLPMLARLDREGLACYLETQNGKNLAIYQRYGFRVAEEGVMPGSAVNFWAMRREKPS